MTLIYRSFYQGIWPKQSRGMCMMNEKADWDDV